MVNRNVKDIVVQIVLYLTLGVTVLFSSCRKYSTDVEEALQLAGENRLELELVLDHYRFQHKQKYEAASFLIANMPYHKSKQQVKLPEAYDDFFAFLDRSEEHTSELQSRENLVCRLLLEKKKQIQQKIYKRR